MMAVPAGFLGAFLLAGAFLLPARAAHAAEFHDDFDAGINPAHWAVIRSADIPRYTLDDLHDEVRMAKRVDATHNGRQSIRLELRYPLLGDFSAEVQFHEAYLPRLQAPTGTVFVPGNSARLTVNFPGLTVSAVHSDEQNAIAQGMHAWIEPPAFAYGRVAATSPSGVLRIQRSGSFCSVFGNGALLTTTFMPSDTVYSVALELVNDGTTDSTSVHFDDFVVTADEILIGNPTLGVVPALPLALTLTAAPNPAAGRMLFGLELAESALARVDVFDLQGRRIATLCNARLDAGHHELAWPGAADGAIAPGLYLAVARTGAARVTRRFVVAR